MFPKFLKDPQTLIGLLLILEIISCALAAPFLAPFDPETQFDDGITAAGEPIAPGSKFIWGTIRWGGIFEPGFVWWAGLTNCSPGS